MTIINQSDEAIEINIEGIIGGSFWDEEPEDIVNTKEQMRAELKAIGAAQVSKIIVNINSYGGDVNHGISIYDMLAQHKAEIVTRVTGFTASIATVIAMAGDTREMSSNALFLIHKPSMFMFGGYNENNLDQVKADLEKVDARIRDIYIKRGAINYIVDRLMEENEGGGKWLDADEAKESQFVDRIYEPMKMAACKSEPKVLSKMGISLVPNKFIDMTNETNALKGMFDELKTFISGILKPEGESTEGVENQEITDKLAGFDAKLKEIELNDQAVAEVETLKAEKVEFEKTIATMTAENKTQKEKVVELEGKLTKINGKSTKVEGVEGMEDTSGVMTAEQKALAADLATLRGTLTNVHQ